VAKPKSAAPPPAEAAQTALGVVRHERRPCGAGADLPLAERRVLWRERLAKASSVSFALQVYTDALSACEAARWDERTLLLVYIVDNLGSVRDRVELWRALLKISPAAADAVYRFLLLRVQTAEDLKALHDALGLERIDPSMLEALLRKARTPSERLDLLRGSAERFKDDTELALLVLDAYEDVRDDAGGRAYARSLRRRVDATAHVRTQVGEYYLRLAARETAPVADRDAEEARRTFGELVEFAPEDPLARRRLGDLLRAHGWYEEAARQYETLSALTPDDSSVQLLRALAANGMGHVEEAVRWAEKAASSESEDGGSPLSTAAHAQASTWLAWARHDALAAGRAEEAERLRSRAARFAKRDSSQARVIVSWAHPELRPALWVQSADALAPASDNLPLYGIAQAFLPEPANVEVRLDPEDAASAARLDVKAVVTAILHEGTSDERIARLEIGFRDADRKPLERVALHFERGELAIVQPKLNREAP
jgi:Ca-activated chloride channel family protein